MTDYKIWLIFIFEQAFAPTMREFILGQKVVVEKVSVKKCLGRKIKGFIPMRNTR